MLVVLGTVHFGICLLDHGFGLRVIVLDHQLARSFSTLPNTFKSAGQNRCQTAIARFVHQPPRFPGVTERR
jgi:hypothetical protein